MKSYIKAAGLIVILIFLVTFGIKNNHLIQLNYYFDYRSIEFPLYILAYGCAVLGIFLGMFIGISSRFRQRRKLKALTKSNNELKAKIEKGAAQEEKPAAQEEKPAAQEEKPAAQEEKPKDQKQLDTPPENKAPENDEEVTKKQDKNELQS
jgi:uncharacterized integral membrane protein